VDGDNGTVNATLYEDTLTNVGYRCNNGSPYNGNVYFDWYFYDQWGPTHVVDANGHWCDDLHRWSIAQPICRPVRTGLYKT